MGGRSKKPRPRHLSHLVGLRVLDAESLVIPGYGECQCLTVGDDAGRVYDVCAVSRGAEPGELDVQERRRRRL